MSHGALPKWTYMSVIEMETDMTNIRKFRRGFSTFLDSFVAAQRAAQRYERLSRLSDTQLSQRGLKRDDLPGIVMRDVLGV